MKIKRVKEIPVEPRKRGRPKGSKNKSKSIEVVREAVCQHDFQPKTGFTNPICVKCNARKRGRPAKVVAEVAIQVEREAPASIPAKKRGRPRLCKMQSIENLKLRCHLRLGHTGKHEFPESIPALIIPAQVAPTVPSSPPQSKSDPDNPFMSVKWGNVAPDTSNEENDEPDGSTALTEAPVKAPTVKWKTQLYHPRYIIEPCPSCTFPEADGGFCPECGWMGGSAGVSDPDYLGLD